MTTTLILYLLLPWHRSAIHVSSVEFASPQACQTAGGQAEAKFTDPKTEVRWFCAAKGDAPSVPQSR